MIRRTHERGQSLVLFVILLLVMVGAAGVLIDGGFAWGHRRQAQSAADMAALAAVKAKMAGGSITAAAETMAAANGFPAGATTCGTTTRSGVIVNNPPVGGWTAPANLDPDTSHYIEVIVNRRMDTAFAAAVGFDCFMVSARAVARFGALTTGLAGTPYPAILAQNSCNGSAVGIEAMT